MYTPLSSESCFNNNYILYQKKSKVLKALMMRKKNFTELKRIEGKLIKRRKKNWTV